MNSSPDASLPGIAHYTFLKQLGQGRFCTVHLAQHFYTEKLYAVKVIDKLAHKPDILIRLRREIELMESLDHPNIIKLHEVIETQFTIYVCMDYVEACSLEQYLKSREQGKLSEKEARRVTRELASAISHCHSRFVVHRDIKPANILVTQSGRVLLIDFGLGNTFSFRTRLNTICGSLPYYSPEIARGSNYTGPEIDIWCLGVVLYRMVVGRDPFVGATKRDVKRQITQEEFRPPSSLSPDLQNTLRTLLAPESTQRRSLAILDNDPWLYPNSKRGSQLQRTPSYSEDGSISETSRLSGTTLVRNSSKDTKSTSWRRESLTESCYYYGKTGSTFENRSLLADTLGAGVWQIGAEQPRFRKNRIRIEPSYGSRNDLLFQKDMDLSILQFLIPILRSCNISYYIHSTSRILCGTRFVKGSDPSSPSGVEGVDKATKNSTSLVLQKLILQVGAAMTGGTTLQISTKPCPTRCGVFSIDIVQRRSKGDDRTGYVLVLKRLIGSSSTVEHFKKQFLYNATPRDTLATSCN
ncbi:Map microtubule affinity-regulating kinase [Entomortierella chlamydospora]|uniref:Map microtubule affinity-regulating kinase n=1 Tax=Entomortierella chlamydospora TaxID=101097 RepID=A0A9P6MXN4_9FUNG|nr:Map microtubule affinity-regulating kinase [Entomortierella chlamydospora]